MTRWLLTRAAAARCSRCNPELDAAAIRTRIVGRKRDAAEGVRLEDAKVIVAGGRGLNGADGFRVLEELAHTLGGAVGASRVPCDLGWCPRSWQIGLTGRTVTPELYIAVGISGAGHHMAGCGNAKAIVAVNTDPEAAIFRDARYGVVGDYQRFIPAFISSQKQGCGLSDGPSNPTVAGAERRFLLGMKGTDGIRSIVG